MMTSETETLKTNEFLRRRKLRLQQVREQSKDIAKKIRQRAKVETLRQVVDLDAKKQKEYFDRQEKLVKRLEVLYAKGLNNVGASHQSASELTQDEVIKTDLSKLRGKEAAAELRKKKQEKLDLQKKVLDRKLQAREAANEISREKSVVTNKLIKHTTSKLPTETTQKAASTADIVKDTNIIDNKDESETVKKNDMATQWDLETIPHEWGPAVPTLTLPKDDQGSSKDDENTETKSDKSKRLDLFALSKEMPLDLRGTQVEVTERRDTTRPSLTLVSEYLQTRKLRLREAEPTISNKKHDDILSLKQTIQRTRTNKAEGTKDVEHHFDVCHVLDEQIVPVPSWHAEKNCEFCVNRANNNNIYSSQFKTVTNSQINTIFRSIRPVRQSDVTPSPVLRSTSPFRRNKLSQRFFPHKESVCPDNTKSGQVLNKKSSVLMYNHYTRDTRDMPRSDEQIVVRDVQMEEDAYAQAMKEATTVQNKDKEPQKKVQDMRNKVAVTKQTVDKEYKDTINFLNSLPKDKGNKVTKVAYMDDRRQQAKNENRQHKLQQEYRKIEKECRRHHTCMNKSRTKSKSPAKEDVDDDFDSRDFQYSWMPVPESDGNLAIHTIPNTVKEVKSSNSVKFSKVDSYHEYRSRHKHTPPTKDTASHERHGNKKRVEAVIIDRNATESTDDSSTTSDTSSVENMSLKKNESKSRIDHKTIDNNLSDTERIIIYKILDSKSDKESKKKNKLLSDIAKSLTSIEKVQKSVIEENHSEPIPRRHNKVKPIIKTADNSVSFEHLNEGIYKVAEEKGDNVASIHLPNEQDNNGMPIIIEDKEVQSGRLSRERATGTSADWEAGHSPQAIRSRKSCNCSSSNKETVASQPIETQKSASTPAKIQSTTTSSSSFKTATNEKTSGAATESGYIKLLDEAGSEAGKFFLSDTGFLSNHAYEVVIQLRKKEDNKSLDTDLAGQTKQSSTEDKSKENERTGNTEIGETVHPVSLATGNSSQAPLNTENDEDFKSITQKSSRKVSPESSKHSSATHLSSGDMTNTQQNTDDIHVIKSSENKKDVITRGTTLQNNYPMQTSQYDPPSRPATTTYTQTTNSPVHRPVYFHMSSSTSTAYMSPPEIILPKFMEHDTALIDFESCGLQSAEAMFKPDKIRKCRHTKRTFDKATMKTMESRKCKQHSTPPNSDRSYASRLTRVVTNHLQTPKISTPSKVGRSDKAKCKCHNCIVPTKNPVKKQCQRSKSVSVGYTRSTQNMNMLLDRNLSNTKNKNKITSSSYNRKKSNVTLNPIVKDYIKKLLALNREGFKALEVADQDCSSVCTPGSSIINVACNLDTRKSIADKISLEQIKKALVKRILDENVNRNSNSHKHATVYTATSKNNLSRKLHRKSVHKVKSLNISKHLLKKHKNTETKPNPVSVSTTTDDNNKTFMSSVANKSRPRSSPTPRRVQSIPSSAFDEYSTAEITPKLKAKKTDPPHKDVKDNNFRPPSKVYRHSHRATITDTSPESSSSKGSHDYYKNKVDIAISMSTQTSQNMDSDFMKLAEDKLQNMEKIADLTEKCTKRLSNLAKVLEEVRKNKSLVYSQISTSESTDSQSEQKSDKAVITTGPIDLGDVPNTFEIKSPEPIPEKEKKTLLEKEKPQPEYVSFLADIPKPVAVQHTEQNVVNPTPSTVANLILPSPLPTLKIDASPSDIIKCRQKPPPALSRIHLKHHQDHHLVPHELSTVIEVDSPMSIKNKTQSSRVDAPNTSNRSSNEDKQSTKNNKNETTDSKEITVNPDLLQTNAEVSQQTKPIFSESSDDSKFQMIDLKHFNQIMLEPFISIHEYAKKYNVEAPDDASNMEDVHRDDAINDDMSSLHSDGSLPDVIAELLKRNIITEPFKFDTASNVNSTTISSESTLSMLALSKARKGKKKTNVMFRNKENFAETSDTLSISSNPDLENAFKKLGMGWASSTLKKTKERLALSSSSNTSSSSLSQFKIKSFNQDIPALVTDSVSSVLLSKKGPEEKKKADNSKNVKQQTSFPNSMTVNEFLNNELANKITFTTNKSGINDTEEEFVSLFETKMPEGMNQQSRDEHSNDTMPSGVNRARTSTPVQIYKSMTYHSSSGSNLSNGLFSNADDLSSVKMTSNSMKNHSTSDRDELTIPNFSLKMKKSFDCKSD